MTRPPIKDTNTNPGLVGLGPIPSLSPVASFNLDQVEDLILTKGFEAFHYMAAPNPDREVLAGPIDPFTQGAYQGQIFYDVRPIKIVPYSMKNEEKLQIYGVYGLGTATFNISGKYYDSRPNDIVFMNNHDLIMMNPTITTKTKQMFEFNPAGNNSLNFKIAGIEAMFDRNGMFLEGEDYLITGGEIEWLKEGRKPGNVNGKRGIVTCIYYTVPIFSIVDVPHNLRILPNNDFGSGAMPRDATYAPQLIYARSLTALEVPNILDWKALPPLPTYTGRNTLGRG